MPGSMELLLENSSERSRKTSLRIVFSMKKTTNSKRIFRLIRAVETILPDLDLVPESLNPRIKQAKDITSLSELLWDAFHEEDAIEGFEKIAEKQGLEFNEDQARKQFRDKHSRLNKSPVVVKKEVLEKG